MQRATKKAQLLMSGTQKKSAVVVEHEIAILIIAGAIEFYKQSSSTYCAFTDFY